MSVPVPDEARSGLVVHPRDVLGLPVLPPAWVVGPVLRLRAGLARVLRAGDPPPVRILAGLQGVLDTAALVTLGRLGVPERLTERMDVEVLASDLGVDPVRLGRLVRYAAARGWVALDPHSRVRPKSVMTFLDRARPSDRLTLVGGDAFTDVPAGCGTYLVVNVLHDWSDSDATRLLATVATAMGSGDGDRSRVIIVEGRTDPRARDEFTARTDLLMFALTAGGRERSATEFAELGSAVGLPLERTVRLPAGTVAHVLHPAEAA